MSKITRLKDIDFLFKADEDAPLGPHLSYTTSEVGGAASGYNDPILLKSDGKQKVTNKALEIIKAAKEIRIEMSMEDFLRKFMHMYYDDAAILTKLLGFESSLDNEEVETYQDYIEEKLESFTILKSLSDGDKKFEDLEYKEQLSVLNTQEEFEEGLSILDKAKNDTNETASDDTSETLNKGEKMSEVETKDKDQNVDLQKSLETLQKQLEAEQEARKALEAKEETRLEKSLIEKASGFSFVEEGETLGKVLKSLEDEQRDAVVAVLEKAQEEITSLKEKDTDDDMFKSTSLSTSEDGADETGDNKVKTYMTKSLQDKYNKDNK